MLNLGWVSVCRVTDTIRIYQPIGIMSSATLSSVERAGLPYCHILCWGLLLHQQPVRAASYGLIRSASRVIGRSTLPFYRGVRVLRRTCISRISQGIRHTRIGKSLVGVPGGLITPLRSVAYIRACARAPASALCPPTAGDRTIIAGLTALLMLGEY